MGETSRAQYERDAVEFASRAVKFDLEGNPGPAAYYYREAAQALQSAILSGSQWPAFLTRQMNISTVLRSF